MLQGMLPPTIKQMIAVTIAMRNNCRYCTRLHSNALEAMGVPQEVIHSCASDPDQIEVPPTQRAIIAFAIKTSQDPESVADEDFQELRDSGLSDGEIMEVAMVANCENFLNTWSRLCQIRNDGE